MTKLLYTYYLENRIAYPYYGNLMIVVRDGKNNGVIDNMPSPDEALRSLNYSDNADGFAIDYELKGINIFNKEDALFFPNNLNLPSFLSYLEDPDFQSKIRLKLYAEEINNDDLMKLVDRYVESKELFLIAKKMYETNKSKSRPLLAECYLENNNLLKWETLRQHMEEINIFWKYLDWHFDCKDELKEWCKENKIEFIDDVDI